MTELSPKYFATIKYIIYISHAKEYFRTSLLEVTHLIGGAIFVSVCLRDGRRVNSNYRQLSYFWLQAAPIHSEPLTASYSSWNAYNINQLCRSWKSNQQAMTTDQQRTDDTEELWYVDDDNDAVPITTFHRNRN
jgi:hypothetical protein